MAPTLSILHSQQQQTLERALSYIHNALHLATPQMQFDHRVGNMCAGEFARILLFAFLDGLFCLSSVLFCPLLQRLPLGSICCHSLAVAAFYSLITAHTFAFTCNVPSLLSLSLLLQRSPSVFDMFKVEMFLYE